MAQKFPGTDNKTSGTHSAQWASFIAQEDPATSTLLPHTAAIPRLQLHFSSYVR